MSDAEGLTEADDTLGDDCLCQPGCPHEPGPGGESPCAEECPVHPGLA